MATNTFDFSSRDYQNIKQDLLRRATIVAPEWTDRDPSDFGMLMVDLWAYMGDVLHYYVDLAAQESFVETATQKESILSFANLFDYIPNYRQSATATVTLANSSTADVVIPAKTEFLANYDGVYYNFYSLFSTTIPASGSQVVQVIEGELIEDEILTVSSSGRIGQRYTLRSEDIVPSSVRVFVYEDPTAPEEWQQVESLSDVGVGVGAFSVYVNAVEETEVVLGSLLNGRVAPAGTKITATYRVSSGVNGNLPANYITTFKASTPAGITIQSSTSSTGGADTESVDSIRRAVQTINRSQNRAVTLSDFADIARRVIGVSKSVASYDDATSTVTVHALTYPTDYLNETGYSLAVPSTTQTNIVDAIEPLAMVGVSVVSATAVDLISVNISATVNVLDSYVASWVESDVETALSALFEFSAVEFGKELRIGDVYRTILGVEGVEYAVVNSVTMYDSPSTTVSAVLPTQLIRKGAITLTITGGVSTA